MIKIIVEDKIKSLLKDYISSKGVGDINFVFEIPPRNIDADLASNIAMVIGKKIKINPRIVANEIIDLISPQMQDYISRFEIAGAGFINLYLNPLFLSKEVCGIIEQKENYGKLKGKTEKIMVEFVSANPTGPLHIGHGRGAAIGDSLSRILTHLGYDVTKEYYINDVGNQIMVLANSLKARYLELEDKPYDMPADGYMGDYIKDIAKELHTKKIEFSKIDFKQEALEYILNTIKKDLSDFNVSFNSWFSETKIALQKDDSGQTEVDKVSASLLLTENAYYLDDALWLASTKYNDDKDRVLKRSDDRYTYLASDIAYHKNKYERGYLKLINLWGADHHGYVARVKAAIQMLGQKEDSLEVILYQLVSLLRNGQTVTMSTRSGEFITLSEVVDEVGKDACRFSFLLRAPDSHLEFDLELAKKQSSDNPVFYVQYVNARCHSIFKESLKRFDIDENISLDVLLEKEEKELMKKICSFVSVLIVCEKTMSPHHLTIYLTELADYYHRFYEKCKVLTQDSKLFSARLKLLKAVSIIIETGLSLVGVSSPQQM